MVRHEALEELEVSGGGFLGLAEHDVTFADGDFRKNFSGGGVADREVGARGPVLLAALPNVAYPLIGFTGFIELSALLWWGIELWRTMKPVTPIW